MIVIIVLQISNMIQHYYRPCLRRSDGSDLLNHLETYSLYVCVFVLLGGVGMTTAHDGLTKLLLVPDPDQVVQDSINRALLRLNILTGIVIVILVALVFSYIYALCRYAFKRRKASLAAGAVEMRLVSNPVHHDDDPVIDGAHDSQQTKEDASKT